MSLKRAWIALGSNTGDREQWLTSAVHLLDRGTVRVRRGSSVYETAPMYMEDQPSFLNAVVEVASAVAPLRLLRRLRAVEASLGRVRGVRNGPRNIDLDLLLYDNLVIRTRELALPHPRMTERRFVLEPLAEIAPGLRHPVLHRNVLDLLSVLPVGGTARVGHIGLTAPLDIRQQ